MNLNNIKRIINQKRKGTFSHMIWEKQLKTRKEFSDIIITKRTSGTVRFGISYNNLKSVIAKRLDRQLPSENNGLPWGEWSLYPYLIKHKDTNYIRVVIDKNNFKNFNTKYYMNGKLVQKESVIKYCLASEFKDNDNIPDTLTLKTDNIISIK